MKDPYAKVVVDTLPEQIVQPVIKAENVVMQEPIIVPVAPVIAGVGVDAEIVTNSNGGSQSRVPYRFDLIHAESIFKMAKVLEYGARRYDPWNWKKIPIEDHLNHLIIHAYAYLAGDTSDEHLSHIMCRAMFAQGVEIENKKKEGDTHVVD